jgi:hypothetical protein
MAKVIDLGAVSVERVRELITEQVPDPLTVAKGGTGATTTAGARDALQLGPNTPIYLGDAAWTGGTVGSVLAAGYSFGRRVSLIQSATAGLHRWIYTTSGNSNPIAGSASKVNFALSWRTTIWGRFQVGTATGSIVSLHTGCPATPTTHDPTEKTHVIQIAGDGAGGRRVRVVTHNGSAISASSWAAWLPAVDEYCNLELIWLTVTSLNLRVNGVSTCTVATGLPSGLGTANSTNLGSVAENVVGSASQVYSELVAWENTRIL